MTQELEDKLFEKYPKIFRQKDLGMQETAMCWGIECRDGWYNLLDALCEHLQFNIDHNSHLEKYGQLEAVQVKEKFGGLRFYTQGSSEAQEAAISFAESLSYKICEECGSMEDVSQTTSGWIVTLCKKCMKKKRK